LRRKLRAIDIVSGKSHTQDDRPSKHIHSNVGLADACIELQQAPSKLRPNFGHIEYR
jgi:hypothetical protein